MAISETVANDCSYKCDLLPLACTSATGVKVGKVEILKEKTKQRHKDPL